MPKIPALQQEQCESIVDYYYLSSPDSLPAQKFDIVPEIDCETFSLSPFTTDISSSSIITMLEVDTIKKHVFAGDINNNTLYRFDYTGNLLDSLQLPSPPTSMKIEEDYYDMTLVGILHPNNESKGEITRYSNINDFSKVKQKLLFDSLIRPVTSFCYDFNYDGLNDYLVGG